MSAGMESLFEFLRQEVTETRLTMYLFRLTAILAIFNGVYQVVRWVG